MNLHKGTVQVLVLFASAFLFISLACSNSQETPASEPQLAMEPGVLAAKSDASPAIAPTTTKAPVLTQRPTSTIEPTSTNSPTATLPPTATPRPTPNPRPIATPIPSATATSERRASAVRRTEPDAKATNTRAVQITVEAGTYHTHELQAAADGYINFRFQSVKAGQPSELLDIGFQIIYQEWLLFQAERMTSFAASVPVQEHGEYQFLFDNTDSILAGKSISLRLSWSREPSWYVLPYFGEHKDTDECRSIEEIYEESGPVLSAGQLLSIFLAVASGNWLVALIDGLGPILVNELTDSDRAANLDNASLAVALWGCGVP